MRLSATYHYKLQSLSPQLMISSSTIFTLLVGRLKATIRCGRPNLTSSVS